MEFDIAIVGLGCIGLSTAYHFAKQGLKVVGVEQYPHSGYQGSNSFGDGRIWRHLQSSQEAVVQQKAAEKLWKQVEEESGEKLLRYTGCLIAGIDNEEFRSYEKTATQDVERLSSQ